MLCLHFTSNNFATFFFPSSIDSTLISIACLMLEISTLVAFAWPILCLATNKLPLASLEPSKILVIATMCFCWAIKHSHFVKGLDALPNVPEFALRIFSFLVCVDVPASGVDAVVSVETWHGTSLFLLANNLLGPPSRMSCLFFKMFLHAWLSICFNCSKTFLLCKHAFDLPSGFGWLIFISLKHSRRPSFNVSSCKVISG